MEEFTFTYRPVLPAAPDPGRAKKDFSRLGFALLVFLVLATALQLAASFLLSRPGMPRSPLLEWGIGYIVPLYVIGVPVTLLVMRPVRSDRWEAHPLGFGKLLLCLLTCFPIMYAGNLVGTILSFMFSGGSAENPLASLVSETGWIEIVVLAVLAPLFEEFIFRKQLIDRTRRYGEKTAIFFSATTFALFHGNLYQFFYAFGLGLLFAYLYTRTRKLRYPAFLHMCVNFVGSVLGPWILEQADLELVDEILAKAAQPDGYEALAGMDLRGILPVYLYGLGLLALVIAGLVVLIRRRKQLLLLPAPEELPKGTGFRVSFLNPGVLLFALACLGMFVFILFL